MRRSHPGPDWWLHPHKYDPRDGGHSNNGDGNDSDGANANDDSTKDDSDSDSDGGVVQPAQVHVVNWMKTREVAKMERWM